MHIYLKTFLFIFFLLSINNAFSNENELSKEFERELKKLKKQVEISSVRSNTMKSENKSKFEILEINTFRDQDSFADKYEIHCFVEYEDRDKTRYLSEYKARVSEIDSDFEEEEFWYLAVPHDELGRIKVSGYAIHYGKIINDKFVLLAEEYDDVKSVEELKVRADMDMPYRSRLSYTYLVKRGQGDDELTERQTLRNLVD